MTPRELSEELREHHTPELQNRRWIIGLSMIGALAGGIVGLYQTGIIKKLPDPPLDVFDSEKVDASDYAYKRLQTPDAFMMLVSYGLTAWLAAASGKNRAEQTPSLPILMAAKTLGDVAVALELGREEWQENKKLCAYCQAATLASLASVALALPEAIKALRKK
jgi:hypothetical protein